MGDLGDLQFLQTKSDAGNLLFAQGSTTGSTTGVLCSITPANGKTFVLYKAHVCVRGNSANGMIHLELRNNGTIRDNVQNTQPGTIGDVDFVGMGDTLVGDGVKTYDIDTVSNTSTDVSGAIEGYLE